MTATAIQVQSPHSNVSKVNPDSLLAPDLIHRLFDFAKNNTNESTFSNYADRENPNFKPVKLPEEFRSLTAGLTGDFYVVGFENRQSTYYTEGTRSVMAILASAPCKALTNEMLTEIKIEQKDPSVATHGNYEVQIKHNVNSGFAHNLNQAKDLDVEKPHGRSVSTYSISSSGKLALIGAEFFRLDEDLIQWRGQSEIVRWNRELTLTKGASGGNDLRYQDVYMIGRDDRGMSKEFAQVTTTIHEVDGEYKKIQLVVGFPLNQSTPALYRSEDRSIEVFEVPPGNINVYKNQMEIVMTDQCYAALKKDPLSEDDFIALMKAKIDQITHHWDKPQSVLGNNVVEQTRDEWKSLSAPRQKIGDSS